MRSPLTTRTIALGALVAVLVAAAFVVVASSAREARRSSDAAQRAHGRVLDHRRAIGVE